VAAKTRVAAVTTSTGEFTDAMSALATGVVLVTCRVGRRPWGMTVTAFHSVSVEPATVLVSLGSGTAAAEAIAQDGRFGVSILPATHVDLARYASRPGAPKYLERFVAPATAESSTPAVEGALAHFDCEVVHQVQVGDHTILVARVRSTRSSGGARPLVYYRRDYRTFRETQEAEMISNDTDHAANLPQADASTLVDRDELERQVQEMYRNVACDPLAPRHFETGRDLALRLGYPEPLLSSVPARALASFAGVGYHLDLAQLRAGDRVLDLGSGSGTDAFCAAALVGSRGSVVGVDFTDAQVATATRLAGEHGIANVRFVEASIDHLPFDTGSFDVVISNGVVNLSPVKQRVFSEAARVLRPSGRLAIADIVSATPLKEATRRNTELWAACIAGAIPISAYLDSLAASGFVITARRRNDYRFLSSRARTACSTYGVESTSIAADRSITA
jgi:arsenite methyltransferase